MAQDNNIKTVKTKSGHDMILRKTGHDGYACCHCFTGISIGGFYGACADCGGIICEACCTNGGLEDHVCEDEEEVE